MTQHAQLPDGTVLEFPDDASPEVIQRVVKQHLGIKATPAMPKRGSDIGYDEFTGGDRTIQPIPQQDTIRGISNSPLDRALQIPSDFANGGMLGGADEVLAGLYALGALMPGGQSPSEAFKENLARLERRRGELDFENPTTAVVANTAGALASPIGAKSAGIIARGTTAADRLGRAAAVSGAGGTITGALSTDGDLTDRAMGAGIGGGIGLVAGPLLQGGAEIGGKAINGVVQAIKDRRLAQTDPVRQAYELLTRAMLRDKTTPAAMSGQAASSAGQGVVDLAGPNVQALGRQTTVAPGSARQIASDFFEGRRIDAANRAEATLRRMVPENADTEIERLSQSKRAIASPLYEDAYAANQSMESPEIDLILKTPAGRQALKDAAVDMQNDRSFMALPDPEKTALVNELVSIGKMPDPNTGVGVATGLKMRSLDFVKKALDKQAAMQARAGDNTGAGIVSGLARDLRHEMDKLDTTAVRDAAGKLITPGKYAQARLAWSGPSHAQDLMNEGLQFVAGPGRTAQKLARIASLSGDDLKAFRIGAVQGAIDKLGKVTDAGSVYQALGNSPDKRKLLEAMFPDRAEFDAVTRRLLNERRMFNTEKVVMGGSPTSRIDADKEDVAEQMRHILDWGQAIGTGNPMSMLRLALTKGGNALRGMNEKTADELAKLLFDQSPQEIQGIIAKLTQGLPARVSASRPGVLQGGRRTLVSPMIGYGSGLIGSEIAAP